MNELEIRIEEQKTRIQAETVIKKKQLREQIKTLELEELEIVELVIKNIGLIKDFKSCFFLRR
jgi:hypothetical protein